MMSKEDYKIRKIQLSKGCNVAYIDEGAGPHTLLFIHGLGMYSLSWRHNIEYLKKHFRCVSIDLPGNGYSDRGDYPYNIGFFAECINELEAKLQLNGVVLVGHSMGGQIALRLAISKPACADRLVLCAPAGFETFNAFERSAYMSALRVADLFAGNGHNLIQSIIGSFYRGQPEAERIANELAGLLEHYPAREYKAMIEACIYSMLHEPVFEELPLIKQKTLVVFGERDMLIPNRLIHFTSTENIAVLGSSKIPEVKLEMVPGAGHFVQVEKAELVNRMIYQFVLEG